MSKEHKIKVQMGTNFKKESVLLNDKGQVVAKGDNKAKLIKEVYGRQASA